MKKNKKIEKDKKLNMRSDKIEKVTIIFASKNVYTKVKTGVIKKQNASRNVSRITKKISAI